MHVFVDATYTTKQGKIFLIAQRAKAVAEKKEDVCIAGNPRYFLPF
jgi:hypothetical protein